MKILLKLIYNVLLGALALIFINLIGQLFNFHIALNIVTSAVVGILGVPGFILLVLLKMIFAIP